MKITASFLLSLLSSCVAAQVINIESKRFLADSNGFTGKSDLSFGISQNIQQVMTFQTNTHAQFRYNRHRLLAISDLTFLRAANQDFVNAGYAHLRYGYKLARLLTMEQFVQAQYNLALKLDRRYLAGAGPRVRFVKKEQIRMYAASLYMYEYQSQNRDSLEKFSHRISSYVTLATGRGRLNFAATAFYQPNLAELQDYRVAFDSSTEIVISRHLNFKTGFNFLYDTRQPLGVPALTYYLRNGLSIRF